MSSAASCELALDADEILTALDDGIEGLDPLAADLHLGHCESCRATARLRLRTRATWTNSRGVWGNAPSDELREAPTNMPTTMARRSTAATSIHFNNDELRQIWETGGGGGERRRAWRLPSFTWPPPRGLVLAAPLCIAAIVFAIVYRHHDGGPPNVVSTTDTATPHIDLRSDQPPQQRSIDDSFVAPAPGPQKAATRSLILPAGSKVMIAFSIGAGAASPTDGSAELIGPASASATDTSLTLQRGTVKVNGLRHVSLFLPGAKLDPNGSTCTIQVDDHGVAHLNVDTGRALITGRSVNGSTAPGMSMTVEAGGAMELGPDGSIRIAPASASSADREQPVPAPAPVPQEPPLSDEETVRRAALAASITPPAPRVPDASQILHDALATPPTGGQKPPAAGASKPTSTAANPEDAISAARTRLRNGETAGARADLEQLAQSSDGRLARRASFTLAEMDLAAGGDRQKARTRLEALVTCPEPALGADAATLLARSMASPRERAAVWQRYLTTNPPRPYLERALLDRAEALLDAGSTREARAILDEAKQSPNLTESQRRQLDRLLVKAKDMH